MSGMRRWTTEQRVTELRRGMLVWADLAPTRGREQSGHRPVLVVASDLYLKTADTLAIVVPASTTDRSWPNHVRLRGTQVNLERDTFALTEQPRTITRNRLSGVIGIVDRATMSEVDLWLRDFLSLP